MARAVELVQNTKPARMFRDYRHFNDNVLESAKLLKDSLSQFIT